MSSSDWRALLGIQESDHSSSFAGGCDVVSLSEEISACAKRGQWQEATLLLADMERNHVSPNTVSVNAAMVACAMSRRWSHALHLFVGMYQSDLFPDITSYNILISACERSGSWQRPLAIFMDMRSSTLAADSTSYNALLSVYRHTCEWGRAIQLLSDMCALHVEVDNESVGAAVNSCELSFQWNVAVALLAQRRSKQNDGLSLACAHEACEEAGKHRHAGELVKELHRRAVHWSHGSSIGRLGFSEYLRISNLLSGLDSFWALEARLLYRRLSAIQLSMTSAQTLCDVGPRFTNFFLQQRGITGVWQGEALRGEIIGRLRKSRNLAFPRLPKAMLLVACVAADLLGSQAGGWMLRFDAQTSGVSHR